MATDLRTDDSHNISYPLTPDTRGTARIYHLRKPYYLGSHDSPLSYVMFGLWKHHLTTKGEAPATASIREQAETLLRVVPSRRRKLLGIGLMATSLTLTTLIGALAGASFRSTPTSTHVDGIALSENETEFIRGVRKTQERIATKLSRSESEAQDTVAISQGRVKKDELLKRIRGY